MKYVIFKNKEILMPIVFHEAINHCDIKIEGWKPVSAGFVYISKIGDPIVDTERISDSLKLKPKEGDEQLIRMFLNNYSFSLFIDYKGNY